MRYRAPPKRTPEMNEIKQQRNSPPKYIPPTINPPNKPNKRDKRIIPTTPKRLSVPILVPSFPKSANLRQNDSQSLFIIPLVLISNFSRNAYKWKKSCIYIYIYIYIQYIYKFEYFVSLFYQFLNLNFNKCVINASREMCYFTNLSIISLVPMIIPTAHRSIIIICIAHQSFTRLLMDKRVESLESVAFSKCKCCIMQRIFEARCSL